MRCGSIGGWIRIERGPDSDFGNAQDAVVEASESRRLAFP